jgi:hypothetical protein
MRRCRRRRSRCAPTRGRLAVVQQRAQVAEGDFRRGRGHVVDRQGRHQLAQRVAGRDVGDVFGQHGVAVMPAVQHGQQRLLDVGFEVERIARGVGDQVDAGQRAVGHQGLGAHVGARPSFPSGPGPARPPRRRCSARAAGRPARSGGGCRRRGGRTPWRAAACTARPPSCRPGQPFRIGFQRFGARQRFEDLEEFLGAEAFLAHAGHASTLATRPRANGRRASGVEVAARVNRPTKQCSPRMLPWASVLRTPMKSSGWSRCSVPSTSAFTIDRVSARFDRDSKSPGMFWPGRCRRPGARCPAARRCGSGCRVRVRARPA